MSILSKRSNKYISLLDISSLLDPYLGCRVAKRLCWSHLLQLQFIPMSELVSSLEPLHHMKGYDTGIQSLRLD